MAKKYDLHPTQITNWKREFLEKSSAVFEKETSVENADKDQLIETLYAQIGQLKVPNDFLKKKLL